MEESIEYQTELFRMMIEKQIFIEGNPRVMAMNFYAPIFFLLSKYSGGEELEEEAQQQLQEQIAEFYRVYRKV